MAETVDIRSLNEKLSDFIVKKTRVFAERHQTKPLDAFKETVKSLFYYSDNQLAVREPDRITYQEYYAGFCSFILDETDGTDFLTNKRVELIRQYYTCMDLTATPDTEYKEQIKKAILAERNEVRRITESTQEIMRILSYQDIPPGILFYDLIKAYQLRGTSEYVSSAGIYSLGYIQGKRDERARRAAASTDEGR